MQSEINPSVYLNDNNGPYFQCNLCAYRTNDPNADHHQALTYEQAIERHLELIHKLPKRLEDRNAK